MEEKNFKFKKQALISISGNATLVISRFACQIIIARLLMPDDVGLIAYLLWLVELFTLLGDFGLKNALPVFSARLRGEGLLELSENISKTLLHLVLCLSIISSLVLVALIYSGIVVTTNLTMVIMVGILCFLRMNSQVVLQYFKGNQTFLPITKYNLYSSIVILILLPFCLKIYGPIGVIISYCLGTALPLVSYLGYFKGDISSIKENYIVYFKKQVFRFSIKSWIVLALGALTWGRFEIFFLEKFNELNVVAQFSIALLYSGIVFTLVQVVTDTLVPHFSNQVGLGGINLASQSFSNSFRTVAFLIIPVSVILTFIAPVMLPVLFGENYKDAIPACMVLTFASITSMAGISNSLLYALDKPNIKIIDGLIGGSITFLGCCIFVPTYGIIGAALVRAVVQVIIVLFNFLYLKVKLKISVPIVKLSAYYILSFLACLIIAILQALFNNQLINFALVPCFFIIYLLLSKLCFEKDSLENSLISTALNVVLKLRPTN